MAIKCYVCDGSRNACMGSAEDLGTLTECPERNDRCVTSYGWFVGDWKDDRSYYPGDITMALWHYYWILDTIDETTPLVT